MDRKLYNLGGYYIPIAFLDHHKVSADILDIMMQAKEEATGSGLSDNELQNEVTTLMAAGHEVLHGYNILFVSLNSTVFPYNIISYKNIICCVSYNLDNIHGHGMVSTDHGPTP